jgi:IS30 family transposase
VERLSEREKQEIERLAALGLPSRLIGAQIGRHHRTVWGHISRLRRPPVREPARSSLRLSLAEREEILRGLVAGESLRVIAGRLGRSASTISRDVAANGGRRRYRACSADRAAVRRMGRPKRSKLASCARLRAVVEEKLESRWSPQQISGWLVEQFADDPEMRVSHETIYLSLFVQSRGALRKELTRYLRSGHTTRRRQGHTVMNGQGQLRGTLNIRERPAEANDRAVPGHWEGDLLMGKRMRAIATLVECKTRFVMRQFCARRTARLLRDLVEAPRAGDAPELVLAPIVEDQTGSHDEVGHRARRPDRARLREGGNPRRDVDGDAADIVAAELDLARVHAAAHIDSELPRGVADCACAFDRPGGTVEGGEEAVAGGFDLAAAETRELAPYRRVVSIEEVAPAAIAELARTFR